MLNASLNRRVMVLSAAVLLLSGLSPASAQTAAWDKLVEDARKEGGVTIYSSQGLKQLNELGKRFEAKYGIPVQVVRAVETDLWPRIDVEHETGAGIADIMSAAATGPIIERSRKGFAVAPAGPAFDDPVYDKAARVPEGTYFENGAVVLTFSWNTALWPQGLTTYEDILDPALKGKVGVVLARTQSQVDFYLYLTRKYGEEFITRLAAQEPHLYPGVLPIAQAVASGEIAVGLHTESMVDEKAAGAPVESRFLPDPWGARYYGMILKSAPHPNAAQLLANFMITREGQEALSRKAGSVLPDVPGTVAYTKNIAPQDLSKLTQDFVRQYTEKWNALFVK